MERAFLRRERLSVTTIGKQHDPVCESVIKFRQSKDGAIVVRGFYDKKQREVFPAQLFAKLQTCQLQDFAEFDSFKLILLAVMVFGADRSAR